MTLGWMAEISRPASWLKLMEDHKHNLGTYLTYLGTYLVGLQTGKRSRYVEHVTQRSGSPAKQKEGRANVTLEVRR